MASWKTRVTAAFAATASMAAVVDAAALSPHPRDVTFLPKRADNTTSSSGWPYGPFKTDGRDIVDSKGDAVTWTGINWPGSGESMRQYRPKQHKLTRRNRRDYGSRGTGVAVVPRHPRPHCQCRLQLHQTVSSPGRRRPNLTSNQNTSLTLLTGPTRSK